MVWLLTGCVQQFCKEDHSNIVIAVAWPKIPIDKDKGGLLGLHQEVTKRCRLSLLTNSVLVYESKRGGGGGIAGRGLSQWVQLCTSRDMVTKQTLGFYTSIFNLWHTINALTISIYQPIAFFEHPTFWVEKSLSAEDRNGALLQKEPAVIWYLPISCTAHPSECKQITTSNPNHLRVATDHYEQPNASQQPNIPRESTLYQPHVNNQTPSVQPLFCWIISSNQLSASNQLFQRATNFQQATNFQRATNFQWATNFQRATSLLRAANFLPTTKIFLIVKEI